MKHISDVLREERIKKGLSIEDVVASIKIRKSFITAIEEGNLSTLPSEAYALGFVKNYASFLGISESKATALFRREYEAAQQESAPKFRKAMVRSKNTFFLNSARGIVALVVGFIVISYLVYQFSFLFIGPRLEIQSPKDNSVVRSNVVVVSGKTDPAANVSIDGDTVYVDLSGSFRKTLYVEEDKIVEIVAKNRSGKETKKSVTVQIEQF